ncbi:MAG: Gfo/Idh/MocA family oxidoreductase [Gemmatimonadota bacterium]|nr:Gfo/Idh/MocA family oxidoreductase [Gemmatimonadota bacterium]
MKTYQAALVGCSRMGAFIDNEVPPSFGAYSHAAGYEACERTELIACSDLRTEAMRQVGIRYGVPEQRQYLDYSEMIEREQPDIVSVATQPEHRAGIVVFAAERGVRAIYGEKAMAASLDEADAMVEAVERAGAVFNMGTNRRWHPGYDAMADVIDSGRIGRLRSLIAHQTGPLFNGASHSFDLLMRLNGDNPVAWVQAHLPNGDRVIDGERLTEDPVGHGILQFENGVTAYALNSGRGMEVEAVGDAGVVTGLLNDKEWHLREHGARDHRGRSVLVPGKFPPFERASSTVRLIEDLVRSLDTGEPPRGGVRTARANTELIFAFVESHVRGGARVALPLSGSKYRLQRDRPPREPKYQRQE